MDTVLKERQLFVYPIMVACVNSSGVKTDPDSAQARVYKASEPDGSLTEISGSPFAMTKQDERIGFYAYMLGLAALEPGAYVVLKELTIAGSATHDLEGFFLTSGRKWYRI